MNPNAMMQLIGIFQDYVSKCDDVQESLEKRGISNERLSSMVTAEAKALSLSLDAQTSKMSPPRMGVRTSVGTKMYALLHVLESQAQCNEHWLNAMGALDIYCLHKPDALETGSTWIFAVALVTLELKTNSTSKHEYKHVKQWDGTPIRVPTKGSIRDIVSKVLDAANEWLDNAGLPCLEWVDVQRQEQTILTSIQWRTSVPTANNWIALIHARFNTMAPMHRTDLLSSSIGQICDYASHWVLFLASSHHTTADLSPRVVAHGMICLSCVAFGVLPDGVFTPSDIDSILDMFKRNQCPQVAQFTTHERVVFLAALIAATGSDFATLQNDTETVNDALVYECHKIQHNSI